MIAVRQYTSADEMRANAAAIRARLWNSSPQVKVAPKPKTVSVLPVARKVPRPKPLWSKSQILFDAHVDAYVVAKRIQEMQQLGKIPKAREPLRFIADIVSEVVEIFDGITIAEVRGGRRDRKVVLARHIAMWEVKQLRPDKSFPEIGRWFGGRDHTTALYAFNKIDALISEGKLETDADGRITPASVWRMMGKGGMSRG